MLGPTPFSVKCIPKTKHLRTSSTTFYTSFFNKESYYGELANFVSLLIQSITERCGQILVTSVTYQNKKKVRINMCPETFNL
jgi:hypothetical protein